jgi:hypothetical protein
LDCGSDSRFVSRGADVPRQQIPGFSEALPLMAFIRNFGLDVRNPFQFNACWQEMRLTELCVRRVEAGAGARGEFRALTSRQV